jgi:hypothetical protein
MHTPLMVFEVRRKRHVLLARQQARRLAALVGFDATETACIAALVFQTATMALRRGGVLLLRFEMSADTFRVVPLVDDEPLPLRVERPLPLREPPVGAEDVAFVAAHVQGAVRSSCFAEVEKLNEDLLRTVLELRACQSRLADLNPRQGAA